MAGNDDAIALDPKSPEVMTSFYQRLYPFKTVFTWLSHSVSNPGGTNDGTTGNGLSGRGPVPAWTHREFAFTLQNDAYLRYLSFNDADELKKQVIKLVPQRFEVGAIYNAKPRDKKTLPPGRLQPTRRELVFDIDMTDYDSIRQCCSGGAVCKRCWGFIAAAVTVLDRSLRRDFGFSLLLWVYSGRRGIHCWVSDESAMQLTDDQRRAIMGWLEVIKGGKEMVKKVNVRGGRGDSAGGPLPLPPSLEEALGILSSEFFIPLILQDQDVFRKRKEGWDVLLDLIPDKEVRSRLESKWAAQAEIEMEDDDDDEETQSNEVRKSEKKWEDLKKEIKGVPKGTPRRQALTAAMEDIVLQYTYPRIDAEVSKHRNHLLKAPFCVHPGTGRVCVPVDPLRVNEFDPAKVPSVGQLLGELDALAGSAEVDELDWEQTSMKPYVEMMEEHNRRILQASRERKMMSEGRKDMSW
ncbi:hypothetical protein M408DRAFT_330457 [Serendipita vermifera MAFF 305830]|uniref:DNA primase n=1 Tax=Serendipita vermifera MAFF 305830 TaxID=933852 RepID=A0A0C2XC30_SERVB|nr:hypothetical protein M408DRAFT_330457 [Serendipita vermifera MAFF 305830]